MSYIGRQPQIGNFQICDAISTVNNQAAYTMQVGSVNVLPETANHMIVSLNGVIQAPISSFTVNGSTITFAANLVTGDVINFIQILGDVLDLGVPSDGTVTSAKLATNIDVSGTLGVGETVPQGKLHVKTSDSGVSSSPSHSNELVLENSTNGGITFNCGASNSATMTFQNSTNADDGSITYRNSEREFRFKTAGADRMRFHSNGVISSTGGIALGVGTANTASNVLDDYEEGTWTPAISGASSVTNLSGSYTKVGNLVTIWVHLLNGNVGGSPSYIITGLPFTVDESRSTTSSIASNLFAANATSVYGIIPTSNTQIELLYNRDGNDWTTQNIRTKSNGYLHCSASYIAN